MRKIYFISFLFGISVAVAKSQCTVVLPSNTIILTSDTNIVFGPMTNHYLLCNGVNVHYTDNSNLCSFYLEPGSSLTLDGYGYSKIYAKENSLFDADSTQYMDLFFEAGTTVQDTTWAPFGNNVLCPDVVFDYSNLPGGVGCQLSTEMIGANEVMNLYPNPVRDELIVSTAMEEFTIELYTFSGALVGIFRNTFRIDMSYLSPGIYIVKWRDSIGIHSSIQRIIKE